MTKHEINQGDIYCWWLGDTPFNYQLGCEDESFLGTVIKRDERAIMDIDNEKHVTICSWKDVGVWHEMTPEKALVIFRKEIGLQGITVKPKASKPLAQLQLF